ncbi:MAG: hypothetical protein IT204_06815 [Fimbriimonadaceae bacterium]|nr:hypothetical protein [Fimbriimonadaceae bacterium]
MRLLVPALERAVDGAASPELTVTTERLGSPGNLLAVTGSATVWESSGGAWIRAGSGTPALPALLPPPYHASNLAAVLPPSAGTAPTMRR